MTPVPSPKRTPTSISARPPLRETPTQSSSSSWDTTITNSSISTSWDTQTVVGDDDDNQDAHLNLNHHQQAILSQRKFLPRDVSAKLEPFNAMPIKLDHFAEGLVSFYLLQYPAATYVFNQNLNPHPVYTNFAM
jgi:hypothetical protein